MLKWIKCIYEILQKTDQIIEILELIIKNLNDKENEQDKRNNR